MIYRMGGLLLLLCVTSIAPAQKTDTVKPMPGRVEVVIEGNKAVNKKLYIVYDSADLVTARIQFENGKMYVINDTLPKRFVKPRLVFKGDSAYKHRNDIHFKSSDSLFKRNDSLFRIRKVKFKAAQKAKQLNDTAFRKRQIEFRNAQKARTAQDTIFRKSQLAFSKSQKLFKESRKLDSLRSLNWKKDSVRIKKELNTLKQNLQRLKTDSARLNSIRRKMIVSKEFNCNDNGQLVIDNIGRKLIIKTTTGNTVKLETVLIYDSTSAPKNVNWEDQFNISVTGDRNKLTIKKANAENPSPGKTAPVVHAFKSNVTIYVPATVKINIEHRYNELVIMDNLISVNLDLFNAPLKMEDAEKAVIKSRYGSVKAGTIKIAELDLLNCNFTSIETEKMQINSKYSTINVKAAAVVVMQSLSDQYSIAKAGDIKGSKSFGQFTIKQLDNSIQLNGTSADLQIDAINASATIIKIENKYADMKFPVQQLPNYSVKFDGDYSNIVTPFEKIKTGARDTAKIAPVFTKTVGNNTTAVTAFIVKCSSCSVDFL